MEHRLVEAPGPTVATVTTGELIVTSRRCVRHTYTAGETFVEEGPRRHLVVNTGFGDYFAVSVGLAAARTYSWPVRAEPACPMDWDATSYTDAPHCIRRFHTGLTVADRLGEVHYDGQIWSQALWEIRTASIFDKRVSAELGLSRFGLYHIDLPPGATTEPHDHMQDEVEDAYAVIRGDGWVIVDGQEVRIHVGQFVGVTKESNRFIRAGKNGCVLIAVCA